MLAMRKHGTHRQQQKSAVSDWAEAGRPQDAGRALKDAPPVAASSNDERTIGDGFDFTLHMCRLCADICARLEELSHVDVGRVAIRFCQARKRVAHGLQATLTPLRFAGGRLSDRRGGRVWTVQRLYAAPDREMLYLLSFYLPRFLDRPPDDKLATVMHELWHISPRFDGDLRRHPGRCYAHSHSQKAYDARMHALARKWLSLDPAPETYDFLRFDFRQLERRNGRIVGQKIATPKLLCAS
jgi:predicted metallopeptidase